MLPRTLHCLTHQPLSGSQVWLWYSYYGGAINLGSVCKPIRCEAKQIKVDLVKVGSDAMHRTANTPVPCMAYSFLCYFKEEEKLFIS